MFQLFFMKSLNSPHSMAFFISQGSRKLCDSQKKEAIAKVQENKEMMEGKYQQNADDLNKEIVELKENLDKAQSLNESLSMKSSTSSTNLQDEDELSADIQL